MRSWVRGAAIFRINAFTEFRRSGPSQGNLNLAATCRSVQLTDFTGFGPTHVVGSRSRHTLGTGQSQSLQGARKHAVGLARTRFSTVAASVFCPRNSLSVIATTQGPESQLCSVRTHLAANSMHAFAPPVGPLRKIIAVHQDVRLQVFVERMARRCHTSGKPSSLQDLSVML